MVKMGMRQYHRIKASGNHRVNLAVLFVTRAAPLEHPKVNEHVGMGGLHQIPTASDLARGPKDGDLHTKRLRRRPARRRNDRRAGCG